VGNLTSGPVHGVHPQAPLLQVFNLTNQRLLNPVIYWSRFGELLGLDFTVVSTNFFQGRSSNTTLSLTRQVPTDATPDQEIECLQSANISLIGM
jgi:hypothetical protein